MSGLTPNRSYPYPQSTDGPPNIPADMLALATALDTDMAATLLKIAALGIPAAPATTSSNDTATSGTTEKRDAALGNYVFTGVAGVRYRACVYGRGYQPTVSGDRFSSRFRFTNNGATPTASDTQAGTDTTFITLGTSGTSTYVVNHQCTFVPGAGTITIALFNKQLSGTGVIVPTGVCEMFVEPIGIV